MAAAGPYRQTDRLGCAADRVRPRRRRADQPRRRSPTTARHRPRPRHEGSARRRRRYAANRTWHAGGRRRGEWAQSHSMRSRPSDTRKAGGAVVLVRDEASTDDIAGLAMCRGLVTVTGAATSHAAVVAARQLGVVCIVGCAGLSLDLDRRCLSIGACQLDEGDRITIDGGRGLRLSRRTRGSPRATWSTHRTSSRLASGARFVILLTRHGSAAAQMWTLASRRGRCAGS